MRVNGAHGFATSFVAGQDPPSATYHEAVLYRDPDTIKPDRVHYVLAKYDDEKRTLQLAHRVSIANERVLRDPAIEMVWGTKMLLGKAKHLASKDVGIVSTKNYCGWYIDSFKLENFPDMKPA